VTKGTPSVSEKIIPISLGKLIVVMFSVAALVRVNGYKIFNLFIT